jgi:hypothetical protein
MQRGTWIWEPGGDRRSRSCRGYVGNRAAVIQALREPSALSTATRRAAHSIRPLRLPAVLIDIQHAICVRRVGRRLGRYPRLHLNVGTTVLVVDDEPNLVDLVKGYLEREQRAHSFAAQTAPARPVWRVSTNRA